MHTRSGREYDSMGSPPPNDPGSSNPVTLEQRVTDLTHMLVVFNEQFTAMRAQLDQIQVSTNEHLDRLEDRGHRPPLVNTPQDDGHVIPQQGRPHHDPYYLRGPPHHDIDSDERLMRSVKIDAPTFDGTLNPSTFLDWLADMDHYFDWYAMSEDRRIRFAKMKLIGHAKLYWNNQERLRRNPITTW